MRSGISRTGLGECSVSWAGAFQIGSARHKPALWQCCCSQTQSCSLLYLVYLGSLLLRSVFLTLLSLSRDSPAVLLVRWWAEPRKRRMRPRSPVHTAIAGVASVGKLLSDGHGKEELM